MSTQSKTSKNSKKSYTLKIKGIEPCLDALEHITFDISKDDKKIKVYQNFDDLRENSWGFMVGELLTSTEAGHAKGFPDGKRSLLITLRGYDGDQSEHIEKHGEDLVNRMDAIVTTMIEKYPEFKRIPSKMYRKLREERQEHEITEDTHMYLFRTLHSMRVNAFYYQFFKAYDERVFEFAFEHIKDIFGETAWFKKLTKKKKLTEDEVKEELHGIFNGTIRFDEESGYPPSLKLIIWEDFETKDIITTLFHDESSNEENIKRPIVIINEEGKHICDVSKINKEPEPKELELEHAIKQYSSIMFVPRLRFWMMNSGKNTSFGISSDAVQIAVNVNTTSVSKVSKDRKPVTDCLFNTEKLCKNKDEDEVEDEIVNDDQVDE